MLVKSVTADDKNYPTLLKEISDRPEKIYYLGKLPETNEVIIAVVGTRKATSEGIRLAKQISHELAARGITVASGLAFGIDGAAHEGALIGGGKTIAVLANGLSPISPRAHYGLAQKILKQNGCLISEYSESQPYHQGQFLERNRLISGLGLAMVVVEAPIRSGSLSTARHALNQGREVFVTPGPANHPNYEGSHMLIRNGARLVTSADEILEDLNLLSLKAVVKEKKQVKVNIEDKDGLAVFEAVRKVREPLNIDKIIEITKLEPQIVNQKLTFLILESLLEERNGKFSIKK